MVHDLSTKDIYKIDPALTCFVLLSKFLGTSADPQQIAHDRGRGDEPYTLEDLARIAKKLDLVARIKASNCAALAKLPLPAIAECQDGAVILLKVDD